MCRVLLRRRHAATTFPQRINLLPIDPDAKVIHHQQDARDDREQPDDPHGQRESDQNVQTEDKEKEGDEEEGHGIIELKISDPIHQQQDDEEISKADQRVPWGIDLLTDMPRVIPHGWPLPVGLSFDQSGDSHSFKVW